MGYLGGALDARGSLSSKSIGDRGLHGMTSKPAYCGLAEQSNTKEIGWLSCKMSSKILGIPHSFISRMSISDVVTRGL